MGVVGELSWCEMVGIGFDLGELCVEVCEVLMVDVRFVMEDILVVSVDELGICWCDYDGWFEFVLLL